VFGLGVLPVELCPEFVVGILVELAEMELAISAADEAFDGERLDVLEVDDGAGNGRAGLVVHATVYDTLGTLSQDLP